MSNVHSRMQHATRRVQHTMRRALRDRWPSRPSYVAVLITIWFLMSALIACRNGEAASAPPPDPGHLTIEAPATVPVGTPLTLHVRADAPVSGSLLLTLDGSGGFVPLTVGMDTGAAAVTLGSLQTRFAGTLTVGARMGDAVATTQIDLTPGAPVDPVHLLVGPRSIAADGAHWTMAVAIPVDARGNPVADDTPVSIHARHPLAPMAASTVAAEPVVAGESTGESNRTATRHLLAWARIFSRTRAGDLLLATTAGKAFSTERTVRVVPGPPASVSMAAGPDGLPADGRQLVTLETAPITDAFDNLMLDGMFVTFLVTDQDGTVQRIPAATVNGQAQAIIPAPSRPGTLTLRALIAGVESKPVELTFVAGPAVTDFAVQVVFRPDELALVAGPMVGALGQFVPDGTVVTFTVTGVQSGLHSLTAVADGGYATAILRQAALRPDTYQVQVTAGTGQGQTRFEVR